MKNKTGLVLAGGGGKGSYQIGVWKALHEHHLIDYFGAVSGTSVGSLNAFLFSTGNLEKAISLWENITSSTILSHKEHGDCKRLMDKLSYIADPCQEEGWFSQEGLFKLIRSSILQNDINNMKIPCYATCSRIKNRHLLYSLSKKLSQGQTLEKIMSVFSLSLLKFNTTAEHFLLNHRKIDALYSVLLATSAIPFVFDDIYINPYYYLDGGLNDNVPVNPLHDCGYRKFLIISLQHEKSDSQKKFKDSSFFELSRGGMLINNMASTFNFNPKSIEHGIQKGYDDCKKQIYELTSFLDEEG